MHVRPIQCILARLLIVSAIAYFVFCGLNLFNNGTFCPRGIFVSKEVRPASERDRSYEDIVVNRNGHVYQMVSNWFNAKKKEVPRLPTGPISHKGFPTYEQNGEFWDSARKLDQGEMLNKNMVEFPKDVNHYKPLMVKNADGEGQSFSISNIPLENNRTFDLKYSIPAQRAQRGIVSCVGGEEMFSTFLSIIVYQKKYLGNELPVHIFYVGDEEMPKEMKRMVKNVTSEFKGEVSFSDISQLVKDHELKDLKHYRVKAFAFLFTPFKETLYLDADMFVPFRSVVDFFNDKDYLATGAGFIHDRYYTGGIPKWQKFWTWSFIGNRCKGDKEFCEKNSLSLRGTSSHDGHSALLVVNTDWKNSEFVNWITYVVLFNHKNSVLHKSVYTWTHGDKETFWMARERAGLKYKFLDKISLYVGRKEGNCFGDTGFGLTTYKGEPLALNAKFSQMDFLRSYEYFSGVTSTPYVDGETFPITTCDRKGPQQLDVKYIAKIHLAYYVALKYRPAIEKIFVGKTV